MTPEQSEFDDPALRDAVRQALAGETAPPALRARIGAMMQDERPAPPATRWRWRIAPQHYRITAAAAMVLIACGFAFYQVRKEFFPPAYPAPVVPAVMQFPQSFALALTRTHDNCAKLKDHHLVGGDDFGALQLSLTRETGLNVFAGPIGGQWQFKGAGLCDIEAARSAHLLFVRGDEALSIFTMPAYPCGHEGISFAQVMEKHALAGFRNGDVLYCVVGSSARGKEITADVAATLALVQTTMCPGTSCQIPLHFDTPPAP